MTGPSVDLTDCDREPIHIPGSIQPHGVLLALSEPELAIVQISENAEYMLGCPPASVLGRPLSALLGAAATTRLHSHLDAGVLSGFNPCQIELTGGDRSRCIEAAQHRNDGLLIAELEPAAPAIDARRFYAEAEHRLRLLSQGGSVHELCGIVAREVKLLTGFDRVMVYRFDPDWHGEVIAEHRSSNLPSYLGLHSPASDIPAQARALYAKNLLRVIPDVAYQPSPLVPALNPLTGQPLDLSCSVLRSVSPIHIEYLRNMGVGASMSISLVCRGRLWGLLACHHAQPLRPPFPVRAAAEYLGRVAAFQIGVLEELGQAEKAARRQQLLTALAHGLREAHDLVPAVTADARLLELLDSDGACLSFMGSMRCIGSTPPREQVDALTGGLSDRAANEEFHTDHLAGVAADLSVLAAPASGVLFLPLLGPGGYLLGFRREIAAVRTWAGNPQEAVQISDAGVRLHPRKSFEQWGEVVRGHSRPWEDIDIQAALGLRRALVDRWAAIEHLRAEAVLQQARDRLELEAAERTVALRAEMSERHSIEARFRAVFEHAAIGIALVREDGGVVQANTALQAMLGYTAAELCGLDVWHITHPEDRPREEAQLQPLLRGAIEHYAMEKRYLRKDGSVVWGSLTASLLPENGGALVLAMVQDIDQRMRALQSIAESEERFRTMVSTAQEGIWLLDASGRITYLNPRLATMLGRTEQALVGRRVTDFVPESARAGAEEQLARRKQGLQGHYEQRLLCEDGSVL